MEVTPPVIAGYCQQLEHEHNIRILFAVENGSRAWGMHSADSDYDVRFVFIRRNITDYLRIAPPNPVVCAAFDKCGQRMPTAQGSLVDMSGFDITKFTKLLAGSNSTAIEWTMSPILHYGTSDAQAIFTQCAANHFSRRSLFWAYKSMSKKHYKTFILTNKEVTHKKYLYALRGAANALWVATYPTLPPIAFVKVYRTMLPESVASLLDQVISIKKTGNEAGRVARIPIFDHFLESFVMDDANVPEASVPKEKSAFVAALDEIVMRQLLK